jgi:hypothetical protein
MKTTRQKRRETTSATLVPTLWLVGACSVAFIAAGYGADPAWWDSAKNRGRNVFGLFQDANPLFSCLCPISCLPVQW